MIEYTNRIKDINFFLKKKYLRGATRDTRAGRGVQGLSLGNERGYASGRSDEHAARAPGRSSEKSAHSYTFYAKSQERERLRLYIYTYSRLSRLSRLIALVGFVSGLSSVSS